MHWISEQELAIGTGFRLWEPSTVCVHVYRALTDEPLKPRAIDFADQYPCAEVTGVDLSPIQSSWVPPNCKFIIDDVESDWPYHENEAFDYIHTRTLCGGIKDWDRLSKQAYDHMKPGGWVEYQEYEAWCKSDDESMSFCPSVELWQQQIDDASTKFGKKMNIAETLLGKLIEAGFQNVHDDPYKVSHDVPWSA